MAVKIYLRLINRNPYLEIHFSKDDWQLVAISHASFASLATKLPIKE